MEGEYTPHDVEWTATTVRRFWDWLSSGKSYQTRNFANLAGDSIIRFLKKHHVPMDGNILDYGCGTGSFLEKLLMDGIACEGAETSKVAADITQQKLSHFDGFRGITVIDKIPTPFADNRFDLVVALETIEHVIPEETEQTLKELHRITKAKGFVILSTPNEEDIDSGKIICPDCGCIFHSGQHMTTWNTKSLSDFMTKLGFSTITCRAVTLRPADSSFNILRDLGATLLSQKKLNLLYLGVKG